MPVRMAGTASDRLVWAVETLAVDPGDRILEVGCGHGVAVSLVCDRLTTGHVTAIDRSQTMIAAATKRNSDYVASGKASFEAVALEEADLGFDRFDKVFAVHVAVFWTKAAETLGSVRSALAPGGALFLFHQAPSWTEGQARTFGEEVAATLEQHGFAADEVVTRPVGRRTRCACGPDRPRSCASCRVDPVRGRLDCAR
jgi:SAM-dependent methyltransferase